MRKLTIIRGKRGCGKTTELNKMTEGKNVLILNPYYLDSGFFLNDLTEDVDVIVFDECSNGQLLTIINRYFYYDTVSVEKKCHNSFDVKTPDFIIIMQSR